MGICFVLVWGVIFAQDVAVFLKPALCSGIMAVSKVFCSLKRKVPGCEIPMGDRVKRQNFRTKTSIKLFEWNNLKGTGERKRNLHLTFTSIVLFYGGLKNKMKRL